MAWLTIPAKVARLSASTSANAGSIPVSEDRAAPARATNPVAPARRDESRSRPLTASGYSRSTISTTGMATSTGVAARYGLIPPPAGTPWSCRTTRAATEAATAVTSATSRRSAARAGLGRPSRPRVNRRDGPRAWIPGGDAARPRSAAVRPARSRP